MLRTWSREEGMEERWSELAMLCLVDARGQNGRLPGPVRTCLFLLLSLDMGKLRHRQEKPECGPALCCEDHVCLVSSATPASIQAPLAPSPVCEVRVDGHSP